MHHGSEMKCFFVWHAMDLLTMYNVVMDFYPHSYDINLIEFKDSLKPFNDQWISRGNNVFFSGNEMENIYKAASNYYMALKIR